MRASHLLITALAAAVGSAACTHKTEVPALSGPSGLSTSLNVTATPDRISQDGAAQSSIQVQAIGPDGRALSGVPIRLDLLFNGVLQDYGSLVSKSVVTGTDGIARTVYTAPPPSTTQSVSTVTVRAVPLGNDAQTSNVFSTEIRLMPIGVILPPADMPTPLYTISPSPVSLNVQTIFDASSSCPGAAVAGVCQPSSSVSITNYQWNFGDGTTGNGKVVSHTYSSIGAASTFTGSLTVTNDRGASATAAITIALSGDTSASFSGDWVSSPPVNTGSVIGQAVLFNADQVRSTAGHQITQYNWNFGDNDNTQPTSGFLLTHTYTQAGTYSVVLSVIDDIGRKKVFDAKTIQIGTGDPIPSFTVVPGAPSVGQTVTFDASTTRVFGSGTTIVSYTWDFGDGGSSTNGPVATHIFVSAATRTVTLRVIDSFGRRGTTSVPVTITP